MPDKTKKSWRPFEEARKYARKLGLQTRCEWMRFIDGRCSSGRSLTDIPHNPAEVYKLEWMGWADWLGAGNNMPVKENKVPQKPVPRKKLKPKKLKPKKLKPKKLKPKKLKQKKLNSEKPRSLDRIRKIADSEEYQNQLTTQNDFCSFEEARKYARKLGLKSHYEWSRFVCTHLKTLPPNIPLNPAAVYKLQWQGWADWLGVLNNTP